jgi:hypothetical protein
MRKARLKGSLAGCAAIALLALPAVAAAAPSREVRPPSTTVTMSLPASNGYRVSIATFPGKVVQLTALKDDVYAEYVVSGRISPHGLNANFGRLGRVSVKFHSSTPPSKPVPLPGRCKGRTPTHEAGKFEGTIEFSGEEGFTAVSATSAKGAVVQEFRRVCPIGAKQRRASAARASGHTKAPQLFVTTLVSAARIDGRSVFFDDEEIEVLPRNHGNPTSHLVVAGEGERRGRVLIQRRALIEGPGPIVASPLGTEPVSATVTLPDPFSGTGSYLEAAGAPATWTGDLSVELPGAGVVPLTGPGFTAIFCHGERHEKTFHRCERSSDANLNPAVEFPF